MHYLRRWLLMLRIMMNFGNFRNVFQRLGAEIKYLKKLRINIEKEVEEIMHRMHDRKRSKRSLIPYIGQGLSWLFGVTTEADLDNIRTQISALGNNQKRNVHIVEHSMTVINESCQLIKENRQSIFDVVASLKQLDRKIYNISQRWSHLSQSITISDRLPGSWKSFDPKYHSYKVKNSVVTNTECRT